MKCYIIIISAGHGSAFIQTTKFMFAVHPLRFPATDGDKLKGKTVMVRKRQRFGSCEEQNLQSVNHQSVHDPSDLSSGLLGWEPLD